MRPQFLLFIPILLSSCAVTESIQKHQVEKAENAQISSLKDENAARHTAFRQMKNWKSKIFRDEAVLALAQAKNMRVQIVLAEQRGTLFVKDLIAYDFPVSTGRKGHLTPTGDFKIIAKELTHHSNLYGKVVDADGNVTNANADKTKLKLEAGDIFEGAEMPFFMRLTNDGVGMHIGQLPGYAASHGCIRLPHLVAPKLYEMAPIGTPVSVTQTRS